MAILLESKEEKLTGKQAAFLAAYIGPANFNAVEAARQAGYSSPHPEGARLLQNATIRAAVQYAWQERGMEPQEIIGRLSDTARGSLDDFVDINEETGAPFINMGKARDRGLLHTFESLEYSDKGRLKVRRYSALDALDKLARIRKMFDVEKAEVEIKVLNVILDALPSEYREQVIAAIDAEFTDGD